MDYSSRFHDKDNVAILPGQSTQAVFIGASPVAPNGSFYFESLQPAEGMRLLISLSSDPAPNQLFFRVDDRKTAGFYVYESESSSGQNSDNNFVPGFNITEDQAIKNNRAGTQT